MSVGIAAPATQAGTVVRFEFNYTLDNIDGALDYFDVELDDIEAPITVANFIQYVNNGLYDNTIIHRSVDTTNEDNEVVPFVMQGGGFSPQVEDGYITALSPITTYSPIKNEFSSTRSNLAGTIAMAKIGGDPDSATSQWFVNLGDNSTNLDAQNGGFTVFGKVLDDGMTLVNSINSLATKDLSSSFGGTFTDVPVFSEYNLVTINKASVISEPAGKLAGSVYVDMNHNGIMDGDDYAVADAKVSITMSGGSAPAATVYSAADGSYKFTNLASGTYSVKMETPNTAAGQDNGIGQMVLDKDGNILNVGTAGTAQENAYNNVWLGDAQSGANFNFAQDEYPVSLVSVRMLINSRDRILKTDPIAVPGTSTADGSILDFGNVLVNATGTKNLTVTNLGSEGSALSGEFSEAGDEFGPADASAYGPLDSGQEAGREYTYTPTVRGAGSKDILITSNVGNLTVTLSGTGVAPVQSVDTTAVDAGLVRIGSTGAAGFTVANIGDGNLSGLGEESNLNGAVAAGSGNFSGPGGSLSLLDSTDQSFNFTYAPTAHATDSTTVAVEFSNGSADGANLAETVNAILTGQGVGPVYSSDSAPDSILDFGTVPQADLKSFFLEISNASTDPNGGDTTLTDLTLHSADISGTNAELFSIAEGFTPGAVLHAGESLGLEIVYNGTGAHGGASAVLTILTDEGAVFGVMGNGFTYQINATLTPEPGSLVLLAIAGLVLGGIFWRRRVFERQ